MDKDSFTQALRDMLSNGVDLTSKIGLNLGNHKNLVDHFMSPFVEASHGSDPTRFIIPEYYLKDPELLFQDMDFKKYSVQLLLYIFYNYIERRAQLSAVQELYRRGWRFVIPLKKWTAEENGLCKVFDVEKWTFVTGQLQPSLPRATLQDFSR